MCQFPFARASRFWRQRLQAERDLPNPALRVRTGNLACTVELRRQPIVQFLWAQRLSLRVRGVELEARGRVLPARDHLLNEDVRDWR